MALYDRIGTSYAGSRATDPRIAAAIHAALGDARSVLNVGAGAGAYEPADRDVLAVEPSAVMIAQRPAGSARVIEAPAEAIPLPDDSVDAAMTVFSDHHWTDRRRGLRELRRVARGRVVLVNSDPTLVARFWMTRDYVPGFVDLIPPAYRAPGFWAGELEELLGATRLVPLPVPHDCADGFYQAYWRRPEAYLRPEIRDNISMFRLVDQVAVRAGIDRLAADLRSGAWRERHRALMTLAELDLGVRVVVSDP